MRLTFALGMTVMLACVMIGDVEPSVSEETADRDEELSSEVDMLEESSPEEEDRKSAEVGQGARPAIEKRGQVIWVKGHRQNRRAFSPWGGKRYFNPWGGKRFKSIQLERKANSVFDKRPGFQPWGGKRGTASPGSVETGGFPVETRAFSPWGGKRMGESPSRDQIDGSVIRQGRNGNKLLLFG